MSFLGFRNAVSLGVSPHVTLGGSNLLGRLSPSLILQFAGAQTMDPRITFTRSTTATYYGTQTALAEQNLLTQSQVNTPDWGTSNGTISPATQVAPDGTTTAATFTDDTATGAHIGNQVPAPVLLAGTDYTMSLYMKAGTSNFGVLTLTNIGTSQNGITAVIDLSSGTITQLDSGTSATAGLFFTEGVGSGWYRVVITGSSVAGFNRAEFGIAPAATGNTFSSVQRISYTGTGTASIYVWGAQLEQRSEVTAYTPTTTAPITNYIPVLQTAAINAPRFDYAPTTQTPLGLLVEESRTNLLTYSEQFNNAAWTKTRASITANAVVSPDGTVDADKLVDDTASGSHTVRNATSVTITSGTTLTASVFAKAAEGAFIIVGIGDGGGVNISRSTFNLSTGAITSSTTAAANVSAPIPSIAPVGNGWYRCSVTATVTVAILAQQWIFKGSNATGAANYTGDGVSGIYIWGAQLEAGPFGSSYIPTVASQVTRAADVAVMTGTNFSTWYNATEGTLYTESSCPNGIASNLNRIASLNDGTTSNRIEIDTGSGTNTVSRITASGVSQGSPSAGSYTDFQIRKSALGIQLNNFTLAANTATSSDTSALVPVVNRLMIGQSPAPSSNYLNGHLRKIIYYPRRLSNAELQGITA
jgi:hypothetical protein